MDRKIVIGHLFKEQLNSYGDGGNVEVLRTRLQERNIKVVVKEYAINENIDFEKLDIIYIGGGKNREKRLVIDCLRDWVEEIKAYIENDGVILVTGSSLSLFGKVSLNPDEEIPGLGILNLVTEITEDVYDNQVVLDGMIDGHKIDLIGYQNIQEVYLHEYQTIAKYDDNRNEGLLYKHMVATSLHGPVLAKNSELADLLIKWAYEKKYGTYKMHPLNDQLENRFRNILKNENI